MLKNITVLSTIILLNVFSVSSQINNCGSNASNTISVNATCVTTNYNLTTAFTNSTSSPSCATSYRDGWFSFTATTTSTTITVTNNNRRMGFAVYSGGCGTLTEEACMNEASGGAGSLSATITTTVGNVYLIRIMRTNNAGSNDMTGTVCVYTSVSTTIGPGGVSSGIELWLKADTIATNSTWGDISGNNRNLTGTSTSNPNANINYNPSYVFNSSAYWRRNGFDLDAQDYPDLNIFHVHNITIGGDCGAPWGMDNSNGGDQRFMNKVSYADMDNGIISIDYGYNLPNGVVEVIPLFQTNVPLISNIEFDVNTNNGSTAHKNDYQIQQFTDQTSSASASFNIGRDGDNDEFTGQIPELIAYSTLLTSTERTKINTYLAIRYGITLINTGGGTQGDYRATDNTLIWDASNSSSYHNDVIGIGRDDDEVLRQKQSHTLDDVTRVYINNLQSTNSANTGTFSNDISYVVLGHNTGQMCATASSMGEMSGSCGLYSRIEREWKVTKTNFSQAFSIDWTLAPCAIPSSVTPNDLRLLVDNDGDFSNGGTSCYYNGDGSGIVISYSGNVVTISNISNTHLANNSTKYITLGSIYIGTPLPVKLLSFNADCITEGSLLTWTVESENNVDYYTIEKSTDGINYSTVTKVEANGNSSSQINYQFNDKKNELAQNTYYRLSQTDNDGTTTYLKVIKSNCSTDNNCFRVYPNPTSGILKVYGCNQNFHQVKLYNTIGQDVTHLIEIVKIQENELRFDLSRLSKGVYYLVTPHGSKKIVIE